MNTATEVLECGHSLSPHESFTTGYGTGYGTDGTGARYCYSCCAENDKAYMQESGKITLYLTERGVVNWPGSLVFPVRHKRTGRHNIAQERTDVWFIGPDGFVWHGVQYGEWTQVLHCKRPKQRGSHVHA